MCEELNVLKILKDKILEMGADVFDKLKISDQEDIMYNYMKGKYIILLDLDENKELPNDTNKLIKELSRFKLNIGMKYLKESDNDVREMYIGMYQTLLDLKKYIKNLHK